MDIYHPQLDKRNFFRVYNCGPGIWSLIYSVLAAVYSHKLHRNVMHYKQTYEKFVSKLNLNSLRYSRGTIKDLKKFLHQNEHLNVAVIIYEGRLSPNSNEIQVWKYGKIGHGEKDVNLLHTFQFSR